MLGSGFATAIFVVVLEIVVDTVVDMVVVTISVVVVMLSAVAIHAMWTCVF